MIPCEGCKTPTGCRISNRCAKPAAPAAPPDNPTIRVAVQAAMEPGAMQKLSADTCFKDGCVETREGREGCVGQCRQLIREAGYAAAQEAAQAGEPSPATPAAVAPPPGQPNAEALQFIMQGRLCIRCKHFKTAITAPKLLGNCMNPALPKNLINGDRAFPALIARGYDELCGPIGTKWEYNGK